MPIDAAVEVKDEEQCCYVRAVLRDIKHDKYLVAFEDKSGSQVVERLVNWDLIREFPPSDASTTPGFVITEDDIVEVQGHPEDNATPIWWEAQVKSIKGEYYKVTYEGVAGGDDIIERDRIRPAYSRAAGVSSKPPFVKQTMQLGDAKVHNWFLQNEQRVLQDVISKSKVLSIVIEPNHPRIKIIGAQKQIARAKMLLELHGKHVGDMAGLQMERERLAVKLANEREKVESGCRLEFPIEKDLIGLVVGKGGKNIAEARRVAGVDRVEVDPTGPKVVVIGPTQESIEAAREILEFVVERVPVQPEQVGWLIGRGGKTFRDLQDKTKVTRLNVDKATNDVVIVGTKLSVEAARDYMETHLQYLNDFQNEQQESDKIRQELRGLTLDGSEERGGKGDLRGRGRGRSGGESRGRGGRAPDRGGGRVPSLSAMKHDEQPVDSTPREKSERGGDRGGRGRGERGGRSDRVGKAPTVPADTRSPPAENGSATNGSSEPREPRANGGGRSSGARRSGRGRGGAAANGGAAPESKA